MTTSPRPTEDATADAVLPSDGSVTARTPVPEGDGTPETAAGESAAVSDRDALANVIHNSACVCLGRGTGLMLRSSDVELMAVAVLTSGYRRVSEDEETVERVARGMAESDGWTWEGEFGAWTKPHYRRQARAVVRALREAADQ